MTKRAGKRKFRMGTQRHPAGKMKTRPDTFTEDHLSPQESLKLEMQAILRNWLANPDQVSKRNTLLNKLTQLGCNSENPDLINRIVRTLSQIEQQTVRNMLAAEAVDRDEKPVVIVQQNNSNGRDTLQEFIESLSPEQAQDWLNKYGARAAAILSANGGTTVQESAA